MSSPDETSPAQIRADEAQVPQSTGSATPSEVAGDDTGGREVGVTAAVERGPAELSSEGEPVRPNPHASLDEGAGEARSTDDL